MASQFGERVAYLPDDAYSSGREVCAFRDDERRHEVAHGGTVSKLRIAVDYLCKPFKVAFRRKRNYSSQLSEGESENKATTCAKDGESVHNHIIPDEPIIHTLPLAMDSMSSHATSHHRHLSLSVSEPDAGYLSSGIQSSSQTEYAHIAGSECFLCHNDINLGQEDINRNISISEGSMQHYSAESTCSKVDGSLESTLKSDSCHEGSNNTYKSKDIEAKTDVTVVTQSTPRWYDFWPSDFTEHSEALMTLQRKSDVHLGVSSSEIEKTADDEERYLIREESTPETGDHKELECVCRDPLKKYDDIPSSIVWNVKNDQSNNEESEQMSREDGSFETCLTNDEEDDIWSDEDLISSQVKGFPPPISILANETHPGLPGHVPRTFWRSVKKGGRFVLQEVQACPREFFQATREHGRLRLQLVRPDMESPLGSLTDDSDPQSEITNHHIISDTKELSDAKLPSNRNGLSISNAISHVAENIRFEHDSVGLDDSDRPEESNLQTSIFPCGNHVVEPLEHWSKIEDREICNSAEKSPLTWPSDMEIRSELCTIEGSNSNASHNEEGKGWRLFDDCLYQFSGKEYVDGERIKPEGCISSCSRKVFKARLFRKDGIPNRNSNDASTEGLEIAHTDQDCKRKEVSCLETAHDEAQDLKLDKISGISRVMGNGIVAPLVQKQYSINQEKCESIGPRESVQVVSRRTEVFLHPEESLESGSNGASLNQTVGPNSRGHPNNDSDQFKPDCCFSPAYGFETTVNNVLSPSQKFFQVPIQPVVR
jgi:hypothetical protein